MVKGVSRRVVVIKSPDGNMFEQAIFILNEGAPEKSADVVREACRIANTCQSPKGGFFKRFSPQIWAVMGAAAASGVWLLGVLL